MLQRADLGPILFTIWMNAAVPLFRQLVTKRPQEPSTHPPSRETISTWEGTEEGNGCWRGRETFYP